MGAGYGCAHLCVILDTKDPVRPYLKNKLKAKRLGAWLKW
jgi:hypothetical protein